MSLAPLEETLDRNRGEGRLAAFLSAVHDQQPVAGLTHNFYRYPARFSPVFARAAIEAFSQPGDVILDPFMGGATTLVEARAMGRHAVGSDISTLSVFLSRVKTTPLGEDDLRRVAEWTCSLPEYLNLHLPPLRAVEWHRDGYQRNLPWPIRKTIELVLARLDEFRHDRQKRFARCLLLKAGQWALDCRERMPSAQEFRNRLIEILRGFTNGMREFRKAICDNLPPGHTSALTLSVNGAAAELPAVRALDSLPSRPKLVVTSPPYPGVHVLYHRWSIHGRKETPAPFWIADCRDGQGGSYYTLGDRKNRDLRQFYTGIRDSFAGVRKIIDPNALVIQMVAFSAPHRQIPRFMHAMTEAGFEEVMPKSLGIPADGRLSRSVPGRRWFALIQGKLATSRETVLFHRPR